MISRAFSSWAFSTYRSSINTSALPFLCSWKSQRKQMIKALIIPYLISFDLSVLILCVGRYVAKKLQQSGQRYVCCNLETVSPRQRLFFLNYKMSAHCIQYLGHNSLITSFKVCLSTCLCFVFCISGHKSSIWRVDLTHPVVAHFTFSSPRYVYST